MILLRAEHVSFGYHKEQVVVQDVSVAFECGSMTALIGSNGCGKSTLIRLLAGVLHPLQGRVVYEGKPMSLAYVPQATTRAFPFTAREVVLTGRIPYGSGFRFESASDIRKANEALAAVGVAHLADRRVTELSGGERQLVSVARALAQEPECLLLDEPAASLDLKHRAELIGLLIRLQRQGITVVMVTHDLNLVQPGFDAVIALRAGQVQAAGATADVMQAQTLAAVYDDPQIRAEPVGGRLCVWSEAQIG